MAIMPDAESFLYLTSHSEASLCLAPTTIVDEVQDSTLDQEPGGGREATGGTATTGPGRPLLGI